MGFASWLRIRLSDVSSCVSLTAAHTASPTSARFKNSQVLLYCQPQFSLPLSVFNFETQGLVLVHWFDQTKVFVNTNFNLFQYGCDMQN